MRRVFGRVALWGGALLAMAAPGQAGRAQNTVRFDALRPVYIEYSQTACAYSCRYRLRYEPLPTPRLLVLEHAESQRTTDAARAPRPLPPVLLDAAQLRRLDGLLRSYRANNRQGSSTAGESVRFSYSEGGEQGESFTTHDPQMIQDLEDADPRDLAVLLENGRAHAATSPALSLRRVVEAAEAGAALGEDEVAYQEPRREETEAFRGARSLERQRRATADAPKTLKKLEGWAEVGKRFRMDRVYAPDPQSGEPLRIELTAREPGAATIDRLRWHNPLHEGGPAHDWRQVLRAHDEAAVIVTRLPWIARWRAAAPGRSVELTLEGDAPEFGPGERTGIERAWEHAGMRGRPYCRLRLVQEGHTAELLVGSEERRTLLIWAAPIPPAERRGDHPLDALTENVRLGLASMSTCAAYCVVSESGVPGPGRRMN